MAARACGATALWQFIGLEAVNTAEVGKEQDPVVRGADEEVADNVVLLQVRTAHALATTALGLVGIDLGALGVARGSNGHNHVFAGDEVLFGDVAGCGNDLGAALVAILVDDLTQLLANNLTLTLRLGQDVLCLLYTSDAADDQSTV